MDVIPAIPHEGPWRISGSERSYDWIGPDSTLPGAGFVFQMFDRWIPITKWATRLRRLFGLGHDSMDGTTQIEVFDCGAWLTALELTFHRDRDAFVNVRNIGGTIHTTRLVVTSETEMTGSFTFELEPAGGAAQAQAALQAAGIDPHNMGLIHMESDRPMQWTWIGTAEQAKESRMKLAACSCRRAFTSALSSRIMIELYSDAELRRQAIDEDWGRSRFRQEGLQKYTPAVEYVYPMTQGRPPNRTEGKLALEAMHHNVADAQAAASVYDEQPGFVNIKSPDVWNDLPKVVQDALAIHETVHQAQMRARRSQVVAEDVLGQSIGPDATYQAYLDLIDTIEMVTRNETEAYVAQFEFLHNWIGEHCTECDGCESWSADKLFPLGTSILDLALASPPPAAAPPP